MARIAGVELARGKRIEAALRQIYGIGAVLARRILSVAGVNPDQRVANLSEQETIKIRDEIGRQCTVEGDLRRDLAMHIKRLMDIGSYRGLRHRRGLPVRGQRTKTNARTRKGRRPSIGVKKKKEPIRKR